MVYRDPDPLWEYYKSVQGFGVKAWTYLTMADHHMSIADMEICLRHFNIDRMAAFNGGIYLFNRSSGAKSVFETARRVLKEREAAGLLAFGPSPVNDEPVLAIAMQCVGVEALPLDGCRAMATALGRLRGFPHVNVLAGRSAYTKNGDPVEPVVIHYNVACKNYLTYRRELWRLELAPWLSGGCVPLIAAMPEFTLMKLRYYRKRISNRFHERGVAGLVPERLLMKLCSLSNGS